VLSGTACGGSTASTSTLPQACKAYADIVSYRETTCYGVTPAPDETDVISRQVETCMLVSSAPGSTVGAEYWNRCAAAANDGCGSYDCGPYPPGALQMGAPCLAWSQCASQWCKGTVVLDADGGSALTLAAQCGTCAPPLTEGEACDPITDTCEIGMSCFQGVCRAQGQQGAACLVWADCAYPWVCRGSGTCDSTLFTGQPCVTDLDCTTDVACDATTKLCAPIQFGQPGSSCDGHVHRCESGRCDTAAGVCPAVLPDGSPCDPTDPSKVCDLYALCFGQRCQIPDPASCQ